MSKINIQLDLAKYLKLNRSTTYYFFKNQEKPIKREKNYTMKCSHQHPELCKLLIEFHFTRKEQIYNYLRIFLTFKEWLKQTKNIMLNLELSTKQIRKIMKDHKRQGLKQTKNNYSKNKKSI